MTDHKYTVACDFDGVIHSYTTPWASADVIPDPPVEGAITWLNEMGRHFKIVIHTTRGATSEGKHAVREWLFAQGLDHHVLPLEVTNLKVPALIYLDDRGWRFTGRNFPSTQEVHEARPWNKPDPIKTTVRH